MKLFMAEICVADFDRSLAWYRDTLGLPVVLDDSPKRFALLDAGAARIALKERRDGGLGADVRLVFEVEDLDREHQRLSDLGESPGPISENRAERYREFRLTDPDGTPIMVFAWFREASGS